MTALQPARNAYVGAEAEEEFVARRSRERLREAALRSASIINLLLDEKDEKDEKMRISVADESRSKPLNLRRNLA